MIWRPFFHYWISGKQCFLCKWNFIRCKFHHLKHKYIYRSVSTSKILNIPVNIQVISCSCYSQSTLRKGCPNRNPLCYIHSIISFVILYETSWNFAIMFGYEKYSSDKDIKLK
jgi:hypothetical protein